MKGKQKILLLVCSVIAVVSVSGMAAYALLKTVTETKTNVFASDKSISIDLTEPQWERYGKEAAKAYVPGQTIDKDPTVSLNDESISAYVALKVQFFDEKNNELTFREFADRYLYGGSELANAGIDWSKDWTFIGNANSDLENDEYASRLMYMYNKPLDKDNANTDIKENISKPLFTKVHLSNEITADNTTKRLPEFNIKATAYAVQAEGVSVEEAKNSLLEMSIVRED